IHSVIPKHSDECRRMDLAALKDLQWAVSVEVALGGQWWQFRPAVHAGILGWHPARLWHTCNTVFSETRIADF
ncbi:MAG TPA: hypothetical protein VN226_01460, partial [Anaerolineales bacterium]|nr:hypothetical protein [Anaerolineales bacterium]